MTNSTAQRQIALGERAMFEEQFGVAEAYFRLSTQLESTAPEAHLHLAVALSSQNKTDECVLSALRAVDLAPHDAKPYQLLAGVYQRQGKFAEAIAAASKVIELDPTAARPYTDIVRSKKIGKGDEALLSRMVEMSNETERPFRELLGLHFALGKAYDDTKDYERAMVSFDAANAIGAKFIGPKMAYSPENESRATDHLIRHFDESFFERFGSAGSTSELPVMIVGMIRSGTTLLETILSSHSKVATAGELPFWEHEAFPLLKGIYRRSLEPRQLAEAASRYRMLLRSIGLKCPRVVDKMPMNYQYIGLIHAAFPNARFIHTRRHPVDTCLSIYTTHFDLPPNFVFSKQNILHTYELYERVMAHWRTVIPKDRFIEVEYEQVVRDRGSVLPILLEFLGLDWEDAVMAHEQTQTHIATPSIWQARQAVYSSSMERWRNYEPWLGEFSSLLRTEAGNVPPLCEPSTLLFESETLT